MLETRKVFIDTQVFVKSGLHFDGAAFKTFRKYCEGKELFHITTSVVEQEVESKIQASVKDALTAIQNFRRKAKILEFLDDEKIKGLFEKVSEEEIYKKSSDVFSEFMQGCSTETAEADSVDAEELISLYFEKKPPFGDGKKKSEFPDAISLLSLKSHLAAHEKIYVVSDDGDLRSYCDSEIQLISISSLSELLDLYTTHTSTRYEQVKEYFVTNEVDVKTQITECLEGHDVWNYSSWENSEVEGGLTVTSLGALVPSILFIDDEEAQIVFDIEVEFEVTVTGPDFNNGIYDREDGRTYPFGHSSRRTTITTSYPVEVSLYYEFEDGELNDAEVNDLIIEEIAGGIEVEVEENEGDVY